MQALKNFMFGKYVQYVKDQKRLQHLDALVYDLGRYHTALQGLATVEDTDGYRDGVQNCSAVFTALVSPHLRNLE